MEQYIFGQVRVQVLDSRVVRIERKSKDKFFDGDTFLVPCHAELCDNAVCSSVDCGNVTVGNFTICLPQDATTIDEVVVCKDGKEVYKCEKTTNSGELPLPGNTPCVYAVSDNPRIVVPEGGYSADRKVRGGG